MDATRSPARERRDPYVGTFSLSSRSGLQTEIVVDYISEFAVAWTSEAEPQTAVGFGARYIPCNVK